MTAYPKGVQRVLDTDGWIECDHCHRRIYGAKIVIGNGLIEGAHGTNLLCYHPVCYPRSLKNPHGHATGRWV